MPDYERPVSRKRTRAFHKRKRTRRLGGVSEVFDSEDDYTFEDGRAYSAKTITDPADVSPEAVPRIKKLIWTDEMSDREVATIFNVSVTVVRKLTIR